MQLELGRRVLLAVLTLAVISLVTFMATNVLPADPARKALGQFSSSERLEQFRERQGLNEPVLERYVVWARSMVTGDWGESLIDNRSVSGKVFPRIVRTVILGATGIALALVISLGLAIYAAQREGSAPDVGMSTMAVFVASLPEFVTGVVLIAIFSVWLGILPVSSQTVAFGDLSGRLEAYALPVMTLAIVNTPYFFRLIRASILDVLSTPFVQSARLRGIAGHRLTWFHVMPNASLPMVSAVLLLLADMLGGLIVVENVFAFPGVGQLLVESVNSGDITTVQAISLLFALGFVSLTLLADVLLVRADPRLRG
jgi:peptide/nickel transport system permease protein